MDKLVKTADVFELRQLVEHLESGFVKALLTVSPDGRYQRVYTRKFLRSYNNDYSYLHKDLAANKDYIKDHIGPVDFQLYSPDQFVVREWKGEVAQLAEQAATVTKSDNGHHVSAAPKPAAEEDDLPF
jgi:hypothetical protein